MIHAIPVPYRKWAVLEFMTCDQGTVPAKGSIQEAELL